jgi:hypothetical protein
MVVLVESHQQGNVKIELSSAKSPCLHPVFGPAFTTYPFFQRYPQSNENFIK